MKSALIIGGGMAGCAAAHQLALAGGWNVTIVEAAPFLGAGVRTQWMGGHPYTFGPRHFLTKNEAVYAFINEYVPMRRCQEHEFITYVEQDQAFYSYPIHEADIARMPENEEILDELLEAADPSILPSNFEEYWIFAVGKTLYGKFIDQYSKKMWGLDDNRKLDTFHWSPKGTAIKSGPRAAWDTAISAYPLAPNGYDDYFGIATAGAHVFLNTKIERFHLGAKTVWINGDRRKFDIIISTISPDVIWDMCCGRLPFMGRDLIPIVLPVEFALPPNVYFCYYAGEEKYTRVTEYKKFTRHKSASTLITLEIPSHSNKLYPMPIKSEQRRAKRYFDLMPDGVFSIGRAGSYDYSVDIDDCIAQAMDMRKAL